ncbi:MAG TPA: DUF4114 domain-containing protein, partial [Flavisolibacter sp.]|nr:DUF4114 domain-containing protein [Flavisolibacter sp.]
LSDYDTSGKPAGLLKDVISPTLVSYMDTVLPEGKDLRTVNPNLLTENTTGDLAMTQKSDVYLTFVKQGSLWYRNSIAFYTYPTATPPASPKDVSVITYAFPNAGLNTPLRAGDKVKLGTFDPGTSIGFVLMQDSWSSSAKKNNNEAVHFCYNDVLNPEVDPKLKKHVVLINYPQEKKVLIGFEDLDRTLPICDHDFNDMVVYVTIEPK